MSAEVESLKNGIPKLKKLYENSAKKMSSNDILGFDLTFAYLDKALQRLELIENVNPSEALYSVDFLKDDGCIITLMQGKALEIIRQYILKAQEDEEENKRLWNDITIVSKKYTDLMLEYQEQKRVLEIVFKKEVDINLLNRSIGFKEYNYSYAYIKGYNFSADNEITEEEYNLLERYYK